MTLPKLSTMTEAEIRVKCAETTGRPGAQLVMYYHAPQGGGLQDVCTKTKPHPWRKNEFEWEPVPDYLRDERAAITLCNWMAENGWEPHIKKYQGVWFVTFVTAHEQKGAVSPSFATAITYAFCIANNLAEL